jgi:hypothetical protein
VTITAAPASSAAWMQGRGAHTRVFGDAARVVLRHVEVGTDEDALAGSLALRTEIGEADDVHGK